MGSSPSKVPASVHARVLSELEAMRIQDLNLDSESDFVYVEEKHRTSLLDPFTKEVQPRRCGLRPGADSLPRCATLQNYIRRYHQKMGAKLVGRPKGCPRPTMDGPKT